MARKTKDITITTGRDKDKVFRITEKSSYDAELWAIRALGGMADAGVDIPDLETATAESLTKFAVSSLLKIRSDLMVELLDEMMECVELVPQPRKEPGVSRIIFESDIEDLSTRVLLRSEIIKLHADFFMVAADQNTQTGAAEA